MTSSESEPIIVARSIYKIFGQNPAAALNAMKDGLGKADILKRYQTVVALRDINFSVRRGETFVVMGLSGSGKSTLIRHLNRLIDPTAGEILIDGRNILNSNARELLDLRRHKVSMVFQKFGLLPHKTVIENVAYGLELAGTARAKAREKAMLQVELVGLAGFERHYPRQLSGGMQQRVGLARALATDADILLMDEAFSALDPLIKADMQNELVSLQRKLKKTIVFITHDLSEALKIGDRIAILKDGEIRQQGRPAQIVLNPVDDYVARFVEGANILGVVPVGRVATEAPAVPIGTAIAKARSLIGDSERRFIHVIDKERRPLGVLPETSLATEANVTFTGLIPTSAVPAAMAIGKALPVIAAAVTAPPVVDEEGRFLGEISARSVVRAMVNAREQAQGHGEDATLPEARPTEETPQGDHSVKLFGRR